MTTSSTHVLRTSIRLMLAAAIAFLALALGLGTQFASAHDSLVESSPAAGEQLDVAPATAVLTFSAEVQSEGTLAPQLALIADAALDNPAVTLDGAATVDGTVVSQPLPELPAGSYTLNWQVVSSDGHPISGSIPFTVTVGVAPVVGGEETTAPSSAFGSAENTESATITSGSSDASDEIAAAPAGDGGIPIWAWVLMGLAGVAVVLTSYVLFRRKAADLESGRQPWRDAPRDEGTGPEADQGGR